MKEFGQTLFNFALVFLFLAILSLMQTTVWFQIFNPLPSANLWLPLIIYITVYRKFTEGTIVLFFLGLSLASLTSKPIPVFFLSLFSVYAICHLVRLKFFWTGASYYVMSCMIGIVSYHVFSWILSFNFEVNHLTSPRWGAWVMEILFTPVVSPFVYNIMRKVDTTTNYADPSEFGFERL